MAAYLAQRIIDGKFTYTAVVTKYPDLKGDIDQYLIDKGYGHLIV